MPQFHFSTPLCLKSIAAQAMWYWAKQMNARKLVLAKNEKDSVNRKQSERK